MIDHATSFPHVLLADGPDPERKDKLGLYAWLVGQWEMDVTTILEDGSTHEGRGEIHAGWVLQGRAIQDVWMIPRLRNRKPRAAQLPGAGNWYGTTLRIYDPNLDAWRILWSDPAVNSSASKLDARKAIGSFRRARIQEAARCAGRFPRSSRTRFTGPASAHRMKPRGTRKSTFARIAPRAESRCLAAAA